MDGPLQSKEETEERSMVRIISNGRVKEVDLILGETKENKIKIRPSY